MSAAPLIVLAAGGTGGHVFPAEALASVLSARGYRLALATDDRGAAYGGALGALETHRLHVPPLGRSFVARIKGIAGMGLAIFAAQRLLKRLRPQAVVGFGGYPSVPTVYAATRIAVPTLIHEQNAVLGRANRLLATRVDAIATSFTRTRFLAAAQSRLATRTGNPVRPAVIALAQTSYSPPAAGEKLRILVTGGSQGAAVFSQVIPAALAALAPSQRAGVTIVQQCRPEELEKTRAAYREAAVDAELATFFSDLPDRIAAAHLVIARAGASTVAELAVAGRPALLVPYPAAADDHQTDNARAFADTGGATIVAQPRFTAEALATRLAELIADPTPLSGMAAAARTFAMPDAAERLADLVMKLAPLSAAISAAVISETTGRVDRATRTMESPA
jgi:UDP-N-acetylglucosamine--N-acetylmuramyl-(pentapeptide) pyrophosphoryl-undecaprenol N-acetylglucosamine transferase